MRGLGFCLSTLAAAALLAVVCPPVRAATDGCRAASHAPSTKIRAADRLAVLFTRRDGPGGVRNFYACLRDGHRLVPIPNLCCSDVQYRLAGRFLAYTYQGSAIGDESNKIGVIDLRTGRLEAITKLAPHSEGGGREIDDGEIIVRLLVTPAGTAFWLEHPTSTSRGPYDLRGATGRPKAERIIDTGNVDPKSLRISHDGRALLYTKDGLPISMTI
ncbi:MAG: hypothetical protein QOF77_269 [Solirubrobacteraceae bacterium]|jgi:hypothetical protein|nr:hypothetical protein [Solirubrobacteraceae bacterium]